METITGNFKTRNMVISQIESLGIRENLKQSIAWEYERGGMTRSFEAAIKSVPAPMPGLYEICLKDGEWEMMIRYRIGSHSIILLHYLATPDALQNPMVDTQYRVLCELVNKIKAETPAVVY